ncbi:CHAT domain-containing tetratricopeptide repeat protein [Polyangium jinanense]|uniref:CHAT domain-containing protein n=1 Tax=Polyangium jinanense TaxID=2829994 RepID=A0A9X4AXD2_9BACT|nr:CHAT domain-containing tetratricopeptide repeat protein [Polyangium jinanense]MDC3959553.1 CHAT domain-containing protein [Polyangium jinanense]MDC3986152.1 CHAT domain-containing protein [Polyangium jinanense]
MARAYRTFHRISSVFLLAGVTLAAAPALGAPPNVAPKAALTSAELAAMKESQEFAIEAQRLLEKKQYDAALAPALKALAIREKIDPESTWTKMSLRQVAEIHEGKKQYTRAVPYREKLVALVEKKADNEADLRYRIHELAEALQDGGEHARAIKLFEREIAISVKSSRGVEGEDVIRPIAAIADSLKALGRYDEAEAMLLRAIKICENVTRNRKPYPYLLVNLGRLYHDTGRYTRAEPIRAQAVERVADVSGFRFNATAEMGDLAATRVALQDYAGAEVVLDELVAIALERGGEDSLSYAGQLALRAALDVETGAYDRAESRLLRAQAIVETNAQKGNDAPELRVALQWILGQIATQKGDFSRAEALLSRTLAHYEKTNGPKDTSVAEVAENLADLYRRAQKLDKAEAHAARALAIRDELLPAMHPDRAESRAIFGRIREMRGDAAGAKKLHEEALAAREKTFGKEHPFVASSLLDLADLARRQKNAGEAEGLYKRAIGIFETTFGGGHEKVAAALEGLAALYVETGKLDLALRAATRAAEIRERQAALVIAGGSEAQKRAFVATMRTGTDFLTSLHARVMPADAEARKLALTTILQRKGRVLDVMAGSLAALRRKLGPEEAKLADELAAARGEVARLAMRGPAGQPLEEFKAELARREEKARAIEEKVGGRSDVFRAEETPVTIERVQAQVPAATALVEISLYVPRRSADADLPSREGPPRFAAYVLDASGKVSFVDLGESAPIEAATKALRETLTASLDQDPKPPARALDALVMQKIRPLLGGKTKLMIAADGALSLVPFAALVDEDGQYLVKRYEISYLTSGRDLLRLARTAPPGQGALVVANPAFGQREQAGSALAMLEEKPDAKTRGLDKAYFEPLPATAVEARALAPILPGAAVHVDLEATESTLKKVHAPRIVHVATHGFFLPAKGAAARAAAAAQGERGLELEPSPDWLPDDPLLRSGLALAGANAKKGGGGEDGILTALEASSLDLWGTKLVVLSACETGLGDVQRGEGVYGLRRALFVAGAEALVASLWKVADEETQRLMVGYYQRVTKGSGRGPALRDVQLAMLADEPTSHPYFWASFGVFGDPSAMGAEIKVEGDRRTPHEEPRILPVKPGPRGCTCTFPGSTGEGPLGLVGLFGVLALVARRRHR